MVLNDYCSSDAAGNTLSEIIVGIYFGKDYIELEVSISDERANHLYDRHRKAGRIPRPLNNYNIGIRSVEYIEYSELDTLYTVNLPNLKLIKINECYNTDEFNKWIQSVSTLKVFISNVVIPHQILEHILVNNTITILKLNTNEDMIEQLCTHDLSTINVTLGWSKKCSPEPYYDCVVKKTNVQNLTLLSMELIDDTDIIKQQQENTECSDYDFGLHKIYTFRNQRLIDKYKAFNCTLVLPDIILATGNLVYNNPLNIYDYDDIDNLYEGKWFNDDHDECFRY